MAVDYVLKVDGIPGERLPVKAAWDHKAGKKA